MNYARTDAAATLRTVMAGLVLIERPIPRVPYSWEVPREPLPVRSAWEEGREACALLRRVEAARLGGGDVR